MAFIVYHKAIIRIYLFTGKNLPHEKSFACGKIFFREDYIVVVTRLNGENKFRLALFRHFNLKFNSRTQLRSLDRPPLVCAVTATKFLTPAPVR